MQRGLAKVNPKLKRGKMKPRHTIKTFVRFKGDFKKEVQDEIPGRDLAEFLAEQLRNKNHAVHSVENDEIWFTVNAASGSIEYPLMVCQSSTNDDYWEISCPRTLGFFARIRGKSEDTELQNLVNTLDEILQDEKTITDIKWYSDYLDLSDDYIQEPGAKRLSIVNKYLGKLFLPLCLIGMVLGIFGVIRSGKESLLARVGAIMFLLPFMAYFGFIAISFLWGLIDDIRQTCRKGLKKKWFRWFSTFAILAILVGPFFLGLLRIPAVERIMPSIEHVLFSLLALLLFGGILFGLSCGVFSDFKNEKNRRKKLLFVTGLFLLLVGVTAFFCIAFSGLGLLKWIPQSIEFPLGDVEGIDVSRDGNLFVASGFYSRIQVYNPEGDFIRGWFLNRTGGGLLKIRINDENEVEVAVYHGKKLHVFDQNGRLLKSRKYDDDTDFFNSFGQKGKHVFDKSTRCHYDVEGWVFPRIIQTGPNWEKKIGKNALYLFPFQGPLQAVVTGMVGMCVMGLAERKKKRR